MNRRFLYAITGLCLLLLAAVGTGQVVQDRTHTIRQSGSDAPAVSVTSSDAAVQSRRQVTQQGDRVHVQRGVQTSGSDPAVQDQSSVVQADDSGRDTEVIRVNDQRQAQPADQPGNQPADGAEQSSLDSLVERREAMAPNVIGDGSDRAPGTEQERAVEERRTTADRATDRADGAAGRADGSTAPAGSQQIVIQQRGRATGEDASLVQQIFITAESLLSGTDMRTRTAGTGSDVSARTNAVLNGNGRRSDAAVDAGVTATGGRAATDQRITTRTGDGRVTVRSSKASQGPDAAVSGQVGVRQRDGRVRVSGDGQRQARDDTGCVTHAHEHGSGDHHGATHIGTHTHRHTHCPQGGQQTGTRQAGQAQRQAAAGCAAHTHEHGWGTHHGEYHIGTHTHRHTHC